MKGLEIPHLFIVLWQPQFSCTLFKEKQARPEYCVRMLDYSERMWVWILSQP